MSTLRVNVIDSAVNTEFKDTITANGDKQWVDSYGVIKTNRNNIGENVTIPTGTNGLSNSPISINNGFTVTVNGEWTIVWQINFNTVRLNNKLKISMVVNNLWCSKGFKNTIDESVIIPVGTNGVGVQQNFTDIHHR